MAALALVLGACRLPYVPGITPAWPAAVADLADASGRVIGRAVFLQERGKVRILVDLKAGPSGAKAVHIHEVGRCDAPTFESAGAHFNPAKTSHGLENPRGPHAGDLPNVTIDSSGRGHLEFTDSRVTLDKGATSLFGASGTSLVLHDAPDDLRTDPDGNSGVRVACGIIVRAQ